MASSPVMPSKPCEKVPGSNRIVEPRYSTSTQECPKCVSRMTPSMRRPDASRGGRRRIRGARPVNSPVPGVHPLGAGTTSEELHVARVVVEVMPKPEILDPQGQAIAGALPRLGFTGVSDVRQGKRFELEVDGSAGDAQLEKIAEALLANTVIEDWTVRRVEA